MDYNKVIKEGGAAEGARAILAYYLTIFTMVEKFGNETGIIGINNKYKG